MRSEQQSPRSAAIKYVQVVVLLAVVALGGWMRYYVVEHTTVQIPIRADARDYYFGAANLKQHGVYAITPSPELGGKQPLTPSSARAPGYSLFLLPFVEMPPTLEMVKRIGQAQAVLGTLTILVVFLVARHLMGFMASWLVALATALSPHLIMTNVYILTEALYTFFIVLVVLAVARMLHTRQWYWAVILGGCVGAAMLVRPTITYFVLLLVPAVYYWLRRVQAGWLTIVVCLLIVLTYGPWVVRNHVVDGVQKAYSLALLTINKGMYPDLMYNNDPKTFGIPNRVDPEYHNRNTWAAVLGEIARRVRAEPLRYLKWYLVDKPKMLLQWNIIVGMGDIFIYPVSHSPYFDSPFFAATHRAMQHLHNPIILLAIFATVLVWHPKLSRILPEASISVARMCELIMLYHIAVHMAGTPLPRYAIPLRPFVYLLGCWLVVLMIKYGYTKKRRGHHALTIDHPEETQLAT